MSESNANESECKKIFANVKYYTSGDVSAKVLSILNEHGAEENEYLSDFVTHVICGRNATEDDLSQANEIYEIPAVRSDWVIVSQQLNELVDINGFLVNDTNLFNKMVFTVSHIPTKDFSVLWSLITYHGGVFCLDLNETCTHVICGKAKGRKYKKALEVNVNVITPDWLLESVQSKTLAAYDKYHPRLLIVPKPIRTDLFDFLGFGDHFEKEGYLSDSYDDHEISLDQLSDNFAMTSSASIDVKNVQTKSDGDLNASKQSAKPVEEPVSTPSTIPQTTEVMQRFKTTSNPPSTTQTNPIQTSGADSSVTNVQNQALQQRLQQQLSEQQKLLQQLSENREKQLLNQQQMMVNQQQNQILSQQLLNQRRPQQGNQMLPSNQTSPQKMASHFQNKMLANQANMTFQQAMNQNAGNAQAQMQQLLGQSQQTNQAGNQMVNQKILQAQLGGNQNQAMGNNQMMNQINSQQYNQISMQPQQLSHQQQQQQILQNKLIMQRQNQLKLQQLQQQQAQQQQQQAQQNQQNQQQIQFPNQLQQPANEQLINQKFPQQSASQTPNQQASNQTQMFQNMPSNAQVAPQLQTNQPIQAGQMQVGKMPAQIQSGQQQIQATQMPAGQMQNVNQVHQLPPNGNNMQRFTIQQRQLLTLNKHQQTVATLQTQVQNLQQQITQQMANGADISITDQLIKQQRACQHQMRLHQQQINNIIQQQQQQSNISNQSQAGNVLTNVQGGGQVGQLQVVQQNIRQLQSPRGVIPGAWPQQQILLQRQPGSIVGVNTIGNQASHRLILDPQTNAQLQQMNSQQRIIFLQKLHKQRQVLMQQRIQQQQLQQQQQPQQQQQQQQYVVRGQVMSSTMPGGGNTPNASPVSNQWPTNQRVSTNVPQLVSTAFMPNTPATNNERVYIKQEDTTNSGNAGMPMTQQQITNDEQQTLLVNSKTKTALANMINIRLQSSNNNGADMGVHNLPGPNLAGNLVGEPSAAGTLRLMTQQINAAKYNMGHRPLIDQQSSGGQHPGRVVSGSLPANVAHPVQNVANAAGAMTPGVNVAGNAQMPPLNVVTPAANVTRVPHFYGHNTNLKLPPKLFLLGCIFVVVEIEESLTAEFPRWRNIIRKRGGEIEDAYNSRVTHVLCRTQKNGVVMQALRDFKRCVTLYWLNDTLEKKRVEPPTDALHFPLFFPYEDAAIREYICITGFTDGEKERVRLMIEFVGAMYAAALCKACTVLVCRSPEGSKYEGAKKLGVPTVNLQWLNDLVLGNTAALRQMDNQRYQQYTSTRPFHVDYNLIPNLMHGWKMPINITQESYERVKRLTALQAAKQAATGAASETTPVKRQRLSTTDLVDMSALPKDGAAPCILLSQIEEDFETYEKIIGRLGGSLATRPATATHFVIPQLIRSLKLMLCIAKNTCHIVTPKWLVDSGNENKYADETKYGVGTFENLAEFNKAYGCSLIDTMAKNDRDKLFENRTFFITYGVFPTRSVLAEMVELSGGKVEGSRRELADIEAMNATEPCSYVVITYADDLPLISDCLYEASAGKKHFVFNAELIMTGILQQKLLFDEKDITVMIEKHVEEKKRPFHFVSR